MLALPLDVPHLDRCQPGAERISSCFEHLGAARKVAGCPGEISSLPFGRRHEQEAETLAAAVSSRLEVALCLLGGGHRLLVLSAAEKSPHCGERIVRLSDCIARHQESEEQKNKNLEPAASRHHRAPFFFDCPHRPCGSPARLNAAQ